MQTFGFELPCPFNKPKSSQPKMMARCGGEVEYYRGFDFECDHWSETYKQLRHCPDRTPKTCFSIKGRLQWCGSVRDEARLGNVIELYRSIAFATLAYSIINAINIDQIYLFRLGFLKNIDFWRHSVSSSVAANRHHMHWTISKFEQLNTVHVRFASPR